jgi:hypothetical protein
MKQESTSAGSRLKRPETLTLLQAGDRLELPPCGGHPDHRLPRPDAPLPATGRGYATFLGNDRPARARDPARIFRDPGTSPRGSTQGAGALKPGRLGSGRSPEAVFDGSPSGPDTFAFWLAAKIGRLSGTFATAAIRCALAGLRQRLGQVVLAVHLQWPVRPVAVLAQDVRDDAGVAGQPQDGDGKFPQGVVR